MKQIDPLLELEARCRSYQPSGSAPVYINCNGLLRVNGSGVVWENVADAYIRSDPNFIKFTNSDDAGFTLRPIGVPIYRPIPAWSQYIQALSGPGADRDYALLFLHERCAKGGAPRLVAAELTTSDVIRERIEVSVIDPDRIDRTQGVRRNLWKLDDLVFPLEVCYPCNAQFFEGEADPSDASHFTIRFTHYPNGIETSAILDGWLLSDDHVQLKPRRSATVAPALPEKPEKRK